MSELKVEVFTATDAVDAGLETEKKFFDIANERIAKAFAEMEQALF